MIEYKVKVYNNGTKAWYLNGQSHREDGPAFESTDGYKAWYLNGQLHRTDGPAVEYSDGTKEWYLNGKQLTEEQFNDRNKVEKTMKNEIEFLKEIKEEIRTANNINCSSYSMENNPTYMNDNNLTAIQSKIIRRIEKLKSKSKIIEMMDDAKEMGLYEDNKVEELELALEELVQIKEYKDKYGKDERYEEAKKQAWKNAKRVLNKIKPSSLNGSNNSTSQKILQDLLNEQEEVIMSPIRFNGVHIEKIKQVFAKYGVEIENEF